MITNPEGSESGGVSLFQTRRGPNPEESCFCQSGGVLFLPIWRGLIFDNPERSYFCQSGGALFLPIRRRLIFANPEGSYF